MKEMLHTCAKGDWLIVGGKFLCPLLGSFREISSVLIYRIQSGKQHMLLLCYTRNWWNVNKEDFKVRFLKYYSIQTGIFRRFCIINFVNF